MIIQQLNHIQEQHGYLPRAALVALAERLAVPLYRIQEVASFYPHYRFEPPPTVEVHVCRDMSCHLRGSGRLIADLQEALGSEITSKQATVCGVSCLGRCDRAPAVRISHNQHADGASQHATYNYLGRSSSDLIQAASDLLAGGANSRVQPDRDADLPDASPAWKINLYAGKPRHECYQALRKIVEALRRSPAAGDAERDRIIQSALKNAVLLGMGGAGGQAFKKWCEVREAAGERKYVVCNADESEPGTFKDREILLRLPHLVVEGVLLAGVVLGACQGYIYIRHEYEECIAAVREEIAWACQQRLAGDDILGSGATMDVEVFVSPGGYICGEQTALIEALQDKRAEPRNRPPELQTNGLWDQPTLVNNVETLAWAPSIILLGESQPVVNASTCRGMEKSPPDSDQSWYGRQGRPFGKLAETILASDKDWQRRHGTANRFPGLRMFSVSGDVNRPGVYEVENGITVRELIEQAGGVRNGRPLKGIAFSGPSGGFTPAQLPRSAWPRRLQSLVPPDLQHLDILDLQMHINYFRAWDLMLGGGIVVYADDADLVQQALSCLRFFQSESCGKCVPCRIGSTKLAEIAADLAGKKLSAVELTELTNPGSSVRDLAFTMASTAICGLGTVAPNPLTTLLRHFPADIAAYCPDAD
jgi:NADH:ubiquinone oxidoreductase subunit F (NADH-binding)/NADH:ubiquinone oxidoreductase subunit E